MNPRRIDAVATHGPACAVGACSVIASYVVLRVLNALTGTAADGRGIYWTEHAGFTWRLVTALLFGALFTLTLSQIAPARTERWVLPAVVLAALAIVLQALLWP